MFRAALIAGGLAAAPALAHADSEQALSVGLSWATYVVPGEAMGGMDPPSLSPTIGGSLTVSYERALGSDLSLRGELVGGLFHGGGSEEPSGTSNALLADAGITYRFDVLKYVPYAFAGVGAVTSGGGPIDRGTDFVLVLGGGVDWLQSRARSYGAEVRVASFGGDITVVTVGLRATSRWGFF